MAEVLQTPYVSSVNADIYIGGIVNWDNANSAAKDNALLLGRMYIDMNYYFSVYIDENDAPIAVQKANAQLAAEYLNNPSEFFSTPSGYGILKEEVKAGDVESKKEYKSSSRKIDRDRFPNISALLSPYAIFNADSIQNPLIR